MIEEYIHLLISAVPNFVPSSEKLAGFLTNLDQLGVLPKPSTITLKTIAKMKPIVRRGINPSTGEEVEFSGKSRRVTKQQSLSRLTDIAPTARSFLDYDIEIVGQGPPALPSIVINFDEAYHMAIVCGVRSHIVSTSDIYAGITPPCVVQFDEDCSENDRVGYFVNPHSLGLIQVPRAGCAKFWVRFEFGKFLFPEISNDNLEILRPEIVQAAS